MADVSCDLLCRGTETADGVCDDEVDLAGVGLCGNSVAGGESGLFAEQLVELVALLAVAVENLEEGGLCAGRSLSTTELQGLADELYGLKIEKEVLRPLRRSLTYGDELSGLEMGVSKSRLGFPFQGKGGEVGNDFGELGDEEIQTIAHKDEFGIIRYIAAGCLWELVPFLELSFFTASRDDLLRNG